MKKITKYIILSPLVFLTFFCFSSIAAQTKGTKIDVSIPPEFGNSNTVLICVLKGIKMYDKRLKKRTIKYYSGKYIFLTEDQLKNEKYNNKKVYRYIFDHSKRTFMTSYGGQYKRFFVYDRLKEEKHLLKTEFTYFGTAIEVFMKMLERKRQNSLKNN